MFSRGTLKELRNTLIPLRAYGTCKARFWCDEHYSDVCEFARYNIMYVAEDNVTKFSFHASSLRIDSIHVSALSRLRGKYSRTASTLPSGRHSAGIPSVEFPRISSVNASTAPRKASRGSRLPLRLGKNRCCRIPVTNGSLHGSWMPMRNGKGKANS